jgi:hypothetical protein
MKYIITQAYNQGDWFTKDFALIRVNDAFKEEIKEIRSFIDSAPEKYRSQVDITIYNIPFCNFYDSSLIEDLEDSELCPDIQQIIIVAGEYPLDGFDDDYIDILNTDNLSCIEGQVKAYGIHAIVSESGVQFRAYNKYGDEEEMWTDAIDFVTILDF